MQDPIKERIVQFLNSKRNDLLLVYLFGSVAKGRERSDSDVDVAFLAKGSPDDLTRFQLRTELACLLNREVDLIDLRKASEVLKVQVIGSGKIILVSDPIARAYFEMYALSDYARLNEERREVLEKITRVS